MRARAGEGTFFQHSARDEGRGANVRGDASAGGWADAKIGIPGSPRDAGRGKYLQVRKFLMETGDGRWEMDGRTQWIFSKGSTVDYHSTAIDSFRFPATCPFEPDPPPRARLVVKGQGVERWWELRARDTEKRFDVLYSWVGVEHVLQDAGDAVTGRRLDTLPNEVGGRSRGSWADSRGGMLTKR